MIGGGGHTLYATKALSDEAEILNKSMSPTWGLQLGRGTLKADRGAHLSSICGSTKIHEYIQHMHQFHRE